jgi:hypothetical protein
MSQINNEDKIDKSLEQLTKRAERELKGSK